MKCLNEPGTKSSGSGDLYIGSVYLRQYSTTQNVKVGHIRIGRKWEDMTTDPLA